MDIIRKSNDHAASLIQQDNLVESKAQLTKAMALLRSSLNEKNSNELNTSKINSKFSTPQSKIHFRSIPRKFLKGTGSIFQEEDEPFYLFSRPFAFDFSAPFDFGRTVQEASALFPFQRAQVSATLLFNLGLVNHLQYLQSGNINGNRDAALQCYEHAMFILLRMAQLQVDDSAMVVRMAVCSNITAIYYDLGRLDELACWRRQLDLTLRSYLPRSTDNRHALVFFHQTLQITLPNAARAA